MSGKATSSIDKLLCQLSCFFTRWMSNEWNASLIYCLLADLWIWCLEIGFNWHIDCNRKRERRIRISFIFNWRCFLWKSINEHIFSFQVYIFCLLINLLFIHALWTLLFKKCQLKRSGIYFWEMFWFVLSTGCSMLSLTTKIVK